MYSLILIQLKKYELLNGLKLDSIKSALDKYYDFNDNIFSLEQLYLMEECKEIESPIELLKLEKIIPYNNQKYIEIFSYVPFKARVYHLIGIISNLKDDIYNITLNNKLKNGNIVFVRDKLIIVKELYINGKNTNEIKNYKIKNGVPSPKGLKLEFSIKLDIKIPMGKNYIYKIKDY